MIDTVIQNIEQLKLFIIVTTVFALVLAAVLFVLCSKFSWTGPCRKYLYMFYGLENLDLIGMSSALLKISLMLTVLISKGNVKVVYLYIYMILQVIYILHRRTFSKILYHIFMGTVTTGLLFLMRMLHGYITEIIYDKRIWAVIMLIGVLLLIQTVTDFVRCLNRIIDRQIAINRRETYEDKNA